MVGKQDRARRIKRASWVGIWGNLVLAVAKIVAGLVAGSLAVVGDGIDSTTDIVTSMITLLAARIIDRKPDQRYPYGYKRAETIATKLLSFIIFFVGAQLALSTVRRIIAGGAEALPGPLAIYVTLVSIAGKVLLAIYQMRAGRRVASSMLIANGKNMQNDVIVSVAVLVGLGFTFILRVPILDAITGLLVSAWILRVAFGIYMESNTELMDGLQDTTIYPALFEAVSSIPGASNPHRARVRRLAETYIVDLDIEVDAGLTVRDAHQIAKRVEQAIRERLPNVYDIMVHVEPLGNVERQEKYGVAAEGSASGPLKEQR